jgi:hypothetical protein
MLHPSKRVTRARDGSVVLLLRSSEAPGRCTWPVRGLEMLGGPAHRGERRARTSTDVLKWRHPMYDMYPDWGPSRHRADEPAYGADQARAGVQAGLDLRDHGGQRPDDN